jgi:hypothetical protein
MRKMVLLALLVIPSICVGQIVQRDTYEVARQALDTLKELVQGRNGRDLGFESPQEAASAVLGQPLAVYMVQLDNLRNYISGENPDQLLKPLNHAIFPVMVGSQVRSSITVEQGRNGPKATRVGFPRITRLLTQARQKAAAGAHIPEDAIFSVQIPALNAQFVAYRVQGRLMLISLLDDPALRLSADRSTPAESVFTSLVQPARAYNGLPM